MPNLHKRSWTDSSTHLLLTNTNCIEVFENPWLAINPSIFHVPISAETWKRSFRVNPVSIKMFKNASRKFCVANVCSNFSPVDSFRTVMVTLGWDKAIALKTSLTLSNSNTWLKALRLKVKNKSWDHLAFFQLWVLICTKKVYFFLSNKYNNFTVGI